MKAFVIERNLPGVGSMSEEELCGASQASNTALAKLAPRIQWQQSYVAGDKTFCVYLAEDDAVIREHAELSGFPADTITEIRTRIDPTTANGAG